MCKPWFTVLDRMFLRQILNECVLAQAALVLGFVGSLCAFLRHKTPSLLQVVDIGPEIDAFGKNHLHPPRPLG